MSNLKLDKYKEYNRYVKKYVDNYIILGVC